jgi:hypothetical protein
MSASSWWAGETAATWTTKVAVAVEEAGAGAGIDGRATTTGAGVCGAGCTAGVEARSDEDDAGAVEELDGDGYAGVFAAAGDPAAGLKELKLVAGEADERDVVASEPSPGGAL